MIKGYNAIPRALKASSTGSGFDEALKN